MKHITIYIIAIITIAASCSSCKKDSSPTTQSDNPWGLPNATQEGKNTLGFLLNGQAWTPQGTRLTGNLSIDFDPGYNNGIFNIVAYNFIPTISEQLTIGIKDSLNFIQVPKTYLLSRNSLYGISYNKPCDYFSQLPEVQSAGSLTITKLDRTNRIIAGTFNAILSQQSCDTIKITEGRFDMKY